MGGQGGWERRSEALVKIQKKKNSRGGRGGDSVWGGGSQGGCEWRSEAFVKFKKKKKKIFFFFWGGGGSGRAPGGRGG